MNIISHRGLCKGHPQDERIGENTLEAFAEGITVLAALGFQKAIEFDVHTTKDDEMVIIHDYTLDRTTNGTGSVNERTLDEIRQLDAGNGRKVPTLYEVLTSFNHDDILFNIELKEADLASRVSRMVQELELTSHVLASAFDNDEESEPGENRTRLSSWADIMTLKGILPFALLATKSKIDTIGIEEFVRIAEGSGASAIHPENIAVTPQLVALAHSHGLKVNVWTVNQRDEYQRLSAMGVDAVFCDNPRFLM